MATKSQAGAIERPILFSGPMVRSIHSDDKTQTRRVVKVTLDERGLRFTNQWEDWHGHPVKCPYGNVGDRLWVREAWAVGTGYDELAPSQLPFENCVLKKYYAADGPKPKWAGRLRPSIHMPRAASRITLEIVSIRVERLQDISEDDALAEGIECHYADTGGDDYQDYYRDYLSNSEWPWIAGDPIKSFRSLWISINGQQSWDDNPCVWVVEFKRIQQ